MKTTFLWIFIFMMQSIIAQDTIRVSYVEPLNKQSQIFSLSPISKKVDNVNGLVFGLGHIINKNISKQTINGLNIEANPAPALGALVGFFAIMHLDDVIKNSKVPDSIKGTEAHFRLDFFDGSPNLKLRGVNLSTGCFFTPTSMSGLNISLANIFKDFKGFSITPVWTIVNNQVGFSIGMINANNVLKGSTVGVYNQSYELKGVLVGVFNQTGNNHGLQVGVFNRSNSEGPQIGLWNINNKRSLPFINW